MLRLCLSSLNDGQITCGNPHLCAHRKAQYTRYYVHPPLEQLVFVKKLKYEDLRPMPRLTVDVYFILFHQLPKLTQALGGMNLVHIACNQSGRGAWNVQRIVATERFDVILCLGKTRAKIETESSHKEYAQRPEQCSI